MAFLTPESVLYVNSEGYTEDNDYNRLILKIQSKNGTTCDYDDLVYEEEKCIEYAETPKWTRIETKNFKSEMEFVQFSFMTKKGSLIGIKDMTIRDCTEDALTPDELLAAKEEAWFQSEKNKLNYVEGQLFEANWEDFKYQRTAPTLAPTTSGLKGCAKAKAEGKKGYWNKEANKWMMCDDTKKPTKKPATARKPVQIPDFMGEQFQNQQSDQHNNHNDHHQNHQNHQQQQGT